MKPEPTSPNGVLVIDKPAGPSSHQIVARVRKQLGVKVGHTGTLDPSASGVLPLVLGRATRLSRFFLASDKEYEAVIQLGRATDTYDAEGKTTFEGAPPVLSDSDSARILEEFSGEIAQTPPMFSAIQISGQRLYKLARQNITVERPQRKVQIFSIEILERKLEEWKLRIACSAGTYIRSLANDIGLSLGCGAFLKALERTRSGQFNLASSVPPDRVQASTWPHYLISLEELLPEMPRVDLGEPEEGLIRHGNRIGWSSLRPEDVPEGASFYRIFAHGQLVAIGQSSGEWLQPSIVLDPAG